MWDIHILKREGAELSYSEKEVTGCAIFTSEYSVNVNVTIKEC